MAISNYDLEFLSRIRRDTLDVLRRHLGGVRRVAILDVPTYQNVGDSMIFAGELAYLRELNIDVVYMADIYRYDPAVLRRRLRGDATILMQGGGNFGDLWPEFQEFRERVVRDFPEYEILHLPQSVYFAQPENAARANEELRAHSHFTLLVRDHESVERARRQLPDVRIAYCPDMALGWTPRAQGRSRPGRNVILARRDRESASGLPSQQTDVQTVRVDWGLSGRDALLWRLVRIPGRIARLSALVRRSNLITPLLRWGYMQMTQLNLDSGVRLFAGATHVRTDRLHAHVLAVLMGIPHDVHDNSYGKIGAIVRDYTGQFSTTTFHPAPGVASE